ncbi:CUB and sushi domain-containing protein 1 isoform X2 [Takifugu flavidus]|uniref:CUB and sushi domain-containing protein 1 isoform X2 n=1 Tax=Takifugu flavidus TaxID=433684 RepID=UPI002544280C|nr:CUB and sushi domain-containing protein 1 isoform X2 [Takifugu flavidus]
MATVGVILLLLLPFGCLQQIIPQIPEWTEELEGVIEWTPEVVINDTYWSGSAPLCVGGCRAQHQELRRDRCGDSSCCWLGYKTLCKVNCGPPDVDYNGVVFGNDWWVGSVVRYACRSGFMLVGSPTRACQPDGRWTPKPVCLRMCQRGRIEVSERELNGTCNATCTNKSYFGPPKHGCTRIDNCKKKETGWKRFFAQCVPCICDCALSCRESFSRKAWSHK